MPKPHKFQSIVLGRKRDISFSVSIQKNLILPTYNIKVFGVTLNDHLKFDAHLYYSVSANQRLQTADQIPKWKKLCTGI